MIFKRFQIVCAVRIIVLAVSIFGLSFLVLNTSLYATMVILSITIVIQIGSLIVYVQKTSRDLARFLDSIRFGDFSQTFTTKTQQQAHGELHRAFNDVLAEFQRTRAEKEEQYHYLQTVIQHIGLGLMAFDQHGDIDLINNAARRILNIPHPRNIDDLVEFSAEYVQILRRLTTGDRSLVTVKRGGEILRLAVHATEFRQQQRMFKLISMQNIESELAEQEMEAWQKLIRVLTHEIMNSVTPIASLASTVNSLLQASADDGQLSSEARKDIHEATATIEKRSQGLLRFIDAYRNFSRLPRPNRELLQVNDLFGRIESLMGDQLKEKGITLTTQVSPEQLQVHADRSMLEQVLINLILNSISALAETEHARIMLTAGRQEADRIVLTLSDNGRGIPDDLKDRIFTPFFTTRKGGSGIGLSLSRQIMQLHKGSISVSSTPHEQTTFILKF